MSSTHHYGSNKGSEWFGNLKFDKDSKITLNKLNWVKDASTLSPTQPKDLFLPVMQKTTTPGEYVVYTPVTIDGMVSESRSGYYVLNTINTVPTFVGTMFLVSYAPLIGATANTQPHPYITQPVPGVFTVQKAGTYTVTADLHWAATAGSSHRWMSFREVVNGESHIELATNSTTSVSGNSTYNSLSYTRYYNIGDTFQINCAQTSGVNQQLNGVSVAPANPCDLTISSTHSYINF